MDSRLFYLLDGSLGIDWGNRTVLGPHLRDWSAGAILEMFFRLFVVDGELLAGVLNGKVGTWEWLPLEIISVKSNASPEASSWNYSSPLLKSPNSIFGGACSFTAFAFMM
jgi:hypothetical protein